MPKKLKISPAQRKDWLARHERGERQDAIASADKVNPRTVKGQIERARIEGLRGRPAGATGSSVAQAPG